MQSVAEPPWMTAFCGVVELHQHRRFNLWFPQGQASGGSSREICGQLKPPEISILRRYHHSELQLAWQRPARWGPPSIPEPPMVSWTHCGAKKSK